MSTHTHQSYACDLCGVTLPESQPLNIVTSISENMFWERLHLKVFDRSGMHNDAKERNADLCKKCAVKLLTDALKRVKGGERATAGTEEAAEQGWGK